MSFSTSVLFFHLKIPLLEMLIAVGNEHLKRGGLIAVLPSAPKAFRKTELPSNPSGIIAVVCLLIV